ncbi:MAG: type II toxin-antitoxin system Phd/YefM family antitoxin [Noviherbaspirillum sp.]
MQAWQMQDAKARLSEVIKLAEHAGPQEITVHGRPVAVLLSSSEFDRLSGRGQSFIEFMQRSPLHGLDELTFEREQTLTRDIPL